MLIEEILQSNPIIAAVNDLAKFDYALESPCKVIFLLTGSILNLRSLIKKAEKVEKKIFIHFDLIDGLTNDSTGIKFVQEYMKPYGIISTKSSLIRKAKDAGFYTIQRLFLLDSLSLDKGINDVKNTRPHAIELMPGVIPKITTQIANTTKTPVITGGLINQKKEVIESLKAGAICISTSKKEIWYM